MYYYYWYWEDRPPTGHQIYFHQRISIAWFTARQQVTCLNEMNIQSAIVIVIIQMQLLNRKIKSRSLSTFMLGQVLHLFIHSFIHSFKNSYSAESSPLLLLRGTLFYLKTKAQVWQCQLLTALLLRGKCGSKKHTDCKWQFHVNLFCPFIVGKENVFQIIKNTFQVMIHGFFC